MSDAKYKWFRDIRRFRDGAGRFVSQRVISEHVSELAENHSADIKHRALELFEDFTSEQFYAFSTDVRRELEALHIAVAVLALGGQASARQYSFVDEHVWQDMEQALAQQLGFFDRFMFAIVSGAVASVALIASRAASYPFAAFATYENAVRSREIMAAGFNEEKRVLQSGQPCIDCIGQAGLGWQLLGTLRRIGQSSCGGNCRCFFIFRLKEKE